MNNVIKLLHQIESELNVKDSEHHKTVERNLELFKVLATVKNDLEKTLKKPDTLVETVYKCIDLLRLHTPYFSTNEGVTKIDPPLTDEQKTLTVN
jgi:hypothetical protein